MFLLSSIFVKRTCVLISAPRTAPSRHLVDVLSGVPYWKLAAAEGLIPYLCSLHFINSMGNQERRILTIRFLRHSFADVLENRLDVINPARQLYMEVRGSTVSFKRFTLDLLKKLRNSVYRNVVYFKTYILLRVSCPPGSKKNHYIALNDRYVPFLYWKIYTDSCRHTRK